MFQTNLYAIMLCGTHLSNNNYIQHNKKWCFFSVIVSFFVFLIDVSRCARAEHNSLGRSIWMNIFFYHRTMIKLKEFPSLIIVSHLTVARKCFYMAQIMVVSWMKHALFSVSLYLSINFFQLCGFCDILKKKKNETIIGRAHIIAVTIEISSV